MNVLDLLLILLAVFFAVSGYRQGFIVGVLSFAGFLSGGLLGLWLIPIVLQRFEDGSTASILAVVVVLALAVVGQMLGAMIGSALRDQVTWHPARFVDHSLGALAGVVSLLVVAWFIGTAVAAGSALPGVTRQVRSSQILAGVGEALPPGADRWFSSFNRLIDSSGFPQVFAPFSREPIVDVDPPNSAVLSNAAVAQASHSIVKILGTSTSCSKVIEGTGFVYAPERIMTNAHVVGGVRTPSVYIRGKGPAYRARVVLYDARRDIAVLYVPGLKATPLQFAPDARRNADAVVAGFPENGGFTARAARIRTRIKASGPDIYQKSTVTRDVYSLYAVVREGNSGGPLLAPDGKVYGVIFAKSQEDDTTGYALTADEVASDARLGMEQNDTVSTGRCAL